VTDDTFDVVAVFDRYAAAWQTRDPDAIALLHTSDTEFRLRLDQPPAIGRDAVRDAFAAIFTQWPEFAFETHRVLFGPDHWVLDWELHARLPDGSGRSRQVAFDCVDIVTLGPDGLVARKDTFVDFTQLQSALTRT
jgi:uncharacterized protein (TIGR02246 family)